MLKVFVMFMFALALVLTPAVSTTAFAAKTPAATVAKLNPKFDADYISKRNVVSMYFKDVKGLKNISYTVIYKSNNVAQGVSGSFTPTTTTVQKEVYLGTCSKNVCVPHKNVKNIKLTVVFTFADNSTKTATINVD